MGIGTWETVVGRGASLVCGDVDICLAEEHPIYVCYDLRPHSGTDCSNHKVISFKR